MLKMQFQEDTKRLIEGTNNIIIISGIAFTSLIIFLIMSFL
jgi:hypothetical protein